LKPDQNPVDEGKEFTQNLQWHKTIESDWNSNEDHPDLIELATSCSCACSCRYEEVQLPSLI
jgi:hypothetical protein